MSQIWDSIQKAEEKRAKQLFQSQGKQQEQQAQLPFAYAKPQGKSWVMPLLVSIVLVSLLGLNVQLYLVMQVHSSKIDTILTTLNKLQSSLDENKDEMYFLAKGIGEVNDSFKTLSLDVAEANLSLADANQALAEAKGKIDKLEKINEENNRTIAELTQYKDSLVRKYDMLDVEIRLLKNGSIRDTRY